jgi:putative phage-type endonuclease
MEAPQSGRDVVARARELLAAEYAEQRSEEWLELRDQMITASDVASAIGENHYETPDAFVKKKVLKTKWAGNAATAHGTLLEPLVRDLYDQRTGRKSHEIGLVQHRVYPWLGASPDGVTEDGLLIEIKCPLTRKIEAKVPKHYLPQVQLQLEITDLEECDFIQYRPAKNENSEPEFVVVRVTRDRAWFAKNLPAMKAAWDRICHGREHGLCALVDEPPRQFKNEIVCEIVDEDPGGGIHGYIRCETNVPSQEPVSEVQGV